MSSAAYQQSQQENQQRGHKSFGSKAITGAANNGSGLIRITATSHGFQLKDRVGITNVGGTVEANSNWRITVITANTFDLIGSTFSNAYTSGGTAVRTHGQ